MGVSRINGVGGVSFYSFVITGILAQKEPLRLFPARYGRSVIMVVLSAKHYYNHMGCFVYWPEGAKSTLNAPILDILDELHDFWNVLLQLLATPNAETDSVEIRVHSAVKSCVLDKAVNLAHVVNSL